MIETILVADDSSTARMIIKRCIEIAGFMNASFIEATDGKEALQLAKENKVDLLITDLNMPNMDGQTLMKHVKASPRLHDLPVVVISSASNKKIETELIENGAFAVVNKPITPASVAKALDNLLQQDQWG